MQKVLKLLLLPPDLLLAHARAYVDLSKESGMRYLCAVKSQWVIRGLSVLALLLALVFGGVALMLWSAMPLHAAPRAWVLLALPGCCLVVSALCGWRASRMSLPPLLQELQAQLALDLPGPMPTALGMGPGMTPTQSLAVSRVRLSQALRDPAWLLLLQRWLERKTPSTSAPPPAGETTSPNRARQKDAG